MIADRIRFDECAKQIFRDMRAVFCKSVMMIRTRKETAFVYQTKAVSFQRNKSLAGFVKYALRVKYGFAM
jgi:methionyl-tRNA formyltransferase